MLAAALGSCDNILWSSLMAEKFIKLMFSTQSLSNFTQNSFNFPAQKCSCFHNERSKNTKDINSWSTKAIFFRSQNSPSLSPVQITLICLIKSLASPRVVFRTKTVQKLCLVKQRHWQRSRKVCDACTSFMKFSRNVYILSLNKTYIKYCCSFRRCLERSVWNITKRVSSRENFSLKLCEFNVQNYSIAQRYFWRLNHQRNYLRHRFASGCIYHSPQQNQTEAIREEREVWIAFFLCYLNFLSSFARRRLFARWCCTKQNKERNVKNVESNFSSLSEHTKKGALKHKLANRFIHLLLIIFHSCFIVAQLEDKWREGQLNI